eukprot:SAG31_NODE_2486_length_5622_cov_3.274489_3_plen_36_part_00
MIFTIWANKTLFPVAISTVSPQASFIIFLEYVIQR